MEEGKKKKKPLTKKEQRRLDEQARAERERLEVCTRSLTSTFLIPVTHIPGTTTMSPAAQLFIF